MKEEELIRNAEWINTGLELPPCDGEFEVCFETLSGKRYSQFMKYDGHGFYIEGTACYHDPAFWREKKKRYGKVHIDK